MKIHQIRRLLFVLAAGSSLLLEGTSSWEAVVSCQTGLTHIDTVLLSYGTSEGLVTGPLTPQGVAITPDSTRAVVAAGADILFLDLTQPITTIVGAITTPGSAATWTAITPDGTIALATDAVAGNLYFIDVEHMLLAHTLAIVSAASIAITTDGSTALVSSGAGLNFVNIGSRTVTSVMTGISGGVAVSPDGTRAFVAGNSEVTFIDLPLLSVIATIPLSSPATDIAVSPDGTLALVTGNTSEVTAINLETIGVIGNPISFGTNLNGVVITPNGMGALVADAGGSALYTLDLTQLAGLTNFSSYGISYITVDKGPFWVAMTPDQAPTAQFTASAQGKKFFFDGSASTSPVGGIRTYIWDFGDGASRTTSTPGVNHTYSGIGPFTVTLTVINDGGTSLDVVFTGRTVSNNGGPSARISQTVTGFAHPSKFSGKVHRSDRNRTALHTWWSKKRNTKEYQIFAHDKKIATIRGSEKCEKTIWLHSSQDCLSKKYRHYLHNKYSIRAVDAYGNASPLRPLHIH